MQPAQQQQAAPAAVSTSSQPQHLVHSQQPPQRELIAASREVSAPRTQPPEGASSNGSEEDAEDSDLSPPPDVSEDLPVSPSDDYRSFTDIVRKMATRLGVSTTQPSPEVEDVFFEVVHPNLSSTVAIPLSRVLLRTVQSTWSKPASVPV